MWTILSKGKNKIPLKTLMMRVVKLTLAPWLAWQRPSLFVVWLPKEPRQVHQLMLAYLLMTLPM